MSLDDVLSGGYHVGLIVAVVMLWRRTVRLEALLADCMAGNIPSLLDLQGGGE